MKNIYCGNLSYTCTEDELRQLFEQFGKVQSAKVIMDRDTGRSRGFGFVEMEVESEADKAIEGLNGQDFGGRNLIVNEARPRGERRGRG
ncbi:MAG: RNA-binding protein [Planctomycetota bacterium]